jgi:hypothetical protein
VPKVFSRRTLEKFEDASASIPLRQVDRAFERADIRRGVDPGGSEGVRRTQFRRYVATVDQRDPKQVARLGDALGTLIAEVAASKVDFLVKAAELDGFHFADGVFRPAKTASSPFTVTRFEDLASIDDRGRQLLLAVNDRAKEAAGGARELIESVCRTVLRLSGEPSPTKSAGLAGVIKTTLKALELGPAAGDAKKGATLVHRCLPQLGEVVGGVGELNAVSPRHARLAAGIAVTLAGFIAETYVERASLKGR